ncbi:hypothetical protein KC328_g59 [Hortaea werneckii]|nr:hypothetical protein KC328_g59 [Hortaea werneckii]
MPISPIRWKSQIPRRCEPCFAHRGQFVVASASRLSPAALPNPVPCRLITTVPLFVSCVFSVEDGGRMKIQLIPCRALSFGLSYSLKSIPIRTFSPWPSAHSPARIRRSFQIVCCSDIGVLVRMHSHRQCRMAFSTVGLFAAIVEVYFGQACCLVCRTPVRRPPALIEGSRVELFVARVTEHVAAVLLLRLKRLHRERVNNYSRSLCFALLTLGCSLRTCFLHVVGGVNFNAHITSSNCNHELLVAPHVRVERTYDTAKLRPCGGLFGRRQNGTLIDTSWSVWCFLDFLCAEIVLITLLVDIGINTVRHAELRRSGFDDVEVIGFGARR